MLTVTNLEGTYGYTNVEEVYAAPDNTLWVDYWLDGKVHQDIVHDWERIEWTNEG